MMQSKFFSLISGESNLDEWMYLTLGLMLDFLRDRDKYSSVVTPKQEVALSAVARYSRPPSAVGSISITLKVERFLRYMNSG